MTRIVCLLAVGFFVTVNQGAAQESTIDVHLSVSGEAKGLFSSAFSGALRSLEDVNLVELDENPDYRLRVVVICQPDECDDALSYALAVQLTRPLEELDVLVAILASAEGVVTDSLLAVAFPLSNSIYERIDRFEDVYLTWVTHWGRNVYRRAAQELVAEIDYKCFEEDRLSNRMAQASDPEVMQSLLDKSTQRIDEEVLCF